MKYPLVKPRYYISLLLDLLNFIRQPTPHTAGDKTTQMKICDMLGLYVLKMVLLIPVVLFFALVYDPENIQGARMADRFSPWALLLVGGFILPLVEEVAFRLSLKFKPGYLALTISVITYYLLTKWVFLTKISAVDESFVLRVAISLSVGLVLFPLISQRRIKKVLTWFWAHQFRWIYYACCLIFAWIHIGKYELIPLNLLLMPILTLPQLISALIYGYTRVSFGFQYPLMLHVTNNVLGITLSFLAT